MNILLLPMILAQAEAVPAKPILKMDAQVQAQPGQIFVVKVETNLKYRKWSLPAGLTRVPPELTKLGEDAFVGYGPAGVYEFKLEGTFNDQFAEAKSVVFVGSPAPVPPQPIPGPGPNDPLATALQRAFEADGKRVDVRDRLCRLWLDAAADVIDNEDYKTLSDFRAAKSRAAPNHPYRLAPSDLLAGCRDRLGDELKAMVGGVESTPLGAAKSELRMKVGTLMQRYASALGATK